MTAPQHIRFEQRGPVATITLHRPEQRNAFDLLMVRELGAALDRIETDPTTRVVVITGSGPAFCAGADLSIVCDAMAGGEGEEQDGSLVFLPELWDLLVRLRELPRPVLAAVNGSCAAGGLELLLCCDLVLAADSARFSDAHARHGLLPGIGGATSLARTVGPFRAKELLFLGEFHSAHDMAALGLVNRVTVADELSSATAALADELARRSPAGLSRMKAMVNGAFDVPWLRAAETEFGHLRASWGSDDFHEGVRAFAERRAPRFADNPSQLTTNHTPTGVGPAITPDEWSTR